MNGQSGERTRSLLVIPSGVEESLIVISKRCEMSPIRLTMLAQGRLLMQRLRRY